MMQIRNTRTVRAALFLVFACAAVAFMAGPAATQEPGTYVGSETCGDCHDVEYENYIEFSKKAHSGDSVKVMAEDLTEAEIKECYVCHTTGYGQDGGFVSFEETPEMANAGCEVCHGPGYDHVEEGGDPDYIKSDLDIEDCTFCHNSERVAAFDFKPMLFGGAH